MCYYENSILMYCQNCNIEFYSSLTSLTDKILPPATWEKYHCNVWLSYGDEVIAFYVPQVSIGGGPGGGGHGPGGGNLSGMVISVPTTPTLKSGVTASGTSIFENNCYLNATVSGGTTVSLTHIGGTVGIDSVQPVQTSGDPRVFTLNGRYLGIEVPATFRGVYIQNGKKHIKLY